MDGDHNTKYCHSKTIVRIRKNKILCLRNETNAWVKDPEKLKTMVMNYFVEFFREDQQEHETVVSMTNYSDLLTNHFEAIRAKASLTELRTAMYGMRPLKAPKKDGFPTLFFHNCWEKINPTFDKLH